MNPENKSFFNHEQEINENKAENKEKKEYINLSFASVADLVRQIEEKGYFDRNQYQRSCEMVVIQNKNTGKYDFWDFGSQPDVWHTENLQESNDEDPLFLDELPEYFKKTGDQNIKLFFCNSEYDTPLKSLNNTDFDNFFNNMEERTDNKNHDYLTPDGFHYRFVFSKGRLEEVIYFDKKQLSLNQVKEIRDLLDKKITLNYQELEEKTIS